MISYRNHLGKPDATVASVEVPLRPGVGHTEPASFGVLVRVAPWSGTDHRQIAPRGHRAAQTVAGADALADVLAGALEPGDMVVCLGAGDITKWAAGLADAIKGARV